MPNAMLTREERIRQQSLEIGEGFGWQMACDFIAAALNSPECMGAKGVMSGEKITRVMEFAAELKKEFVPAFRPRDPEADVWQERLDKLQRKIFKDNYDPFEKRYPELKRVRYGKK